MPDHVDSFVTKQYEHLLSGEAAVEILVLEVSRSEFYSIAFALAEHMLDEGFYAHFIDGDRLWVIFPNCVCTALRGDTTAIERCRAFGRSFKVPEEQMPFDQLFVKDHPNEK